MLISLDKLREILIKVASFQLHLHLCCVGLAVKVNFLVA